MSEMKFPKIKFPKIKLQKNNSQEEVEKEFEKGNIVLPTGLRDYENFNEFKEKTSHLENIQSELEVIENSK